MNLGIEGYIKVTSEDEHHLRGRQGQDLSG